MSSNPVSSQPRPRPRPKASRTAAAVESVETLPESGQPRPRPRPKVSRTTAAVESVETLPESPVSRSRPKVSRTQTDVANLVKSAETLPDNVPRPRPKTKTYAQVVATPSPPRKDLAPRPKVGQINESPEASVIELTSSPGATPPTLKTVQRSRLARVPPSQPTGAPMITRSSNGISKKRVLEDAAVFSDQESSTVVSPSKKQKRSKAPVFSSPRTPPRRSTRLLSPASDFPASDATPLPSISAELKKRPGLSISPMKLSSVKNEDPVIETTLLPSAVIRSSSRESSLAPEFTAWQSNDSRHYREVKEKVARRHKHKERERSATPVNWSPTPTPVKSCKSKGKARASSFFLDEEPLPAIKTFSDDEEDLMRAKAESRKAHALSKLNSGLKESSSSANKDASKETRALESSLAPELKEPKLSSFAAALAKKGASVKKVQLLSNGSKSNEQYLEDLNGYQVSSLPETCQVNFPASQDLLLEEDYSALPNLIAGTFESWSKAVGDGFVIFSGWAEQLPALDVDEALVALRFTQYRHFINMSRISPLKLRSVYTGPDTTRSVLYAEGRVAICLSAILVVESHLLSPSLTGLRNKYLKGKLHDQEMQRFVGATCMSFAQPVLQAQIEKDNMIFATKGDWPQGGKSGTPSASRYIRSSALLGKSPSKIGHSTKQILDVTDTVPIYDAREHLFDFAADFDNIDLVLPKFEGEIPAGSFAVVAYTMSTYSKGFVCHLSTNVQFAILIKDFE